MNLCAGFLRKRTMAAEQTQELIGNTQRDRTLVKRAFKSKTFVIGFTIICLIAMVSLLAPVLAEYDPIKTSLLEALQPPSRVHWFGTDNFGRDIFTRVLYGGRTALLTGIGCVIIPLVVGTILGSVAGFFGGRFDDVIMRLVDITIALPYLVLVIAILAIIGPGLRNVFISVWLVGWTAYARIIRGEILSLKEREFVEAAKALGCSTSHIIRRHILPNAITPALVFSVTDVVLCILLASALSFLGLGVQPPTPDWGAMISEGRIFIYQAWWMTTFPGLAIMAIGIGFSLVGDGLADVLRPKD